MLLIISQLESWSFVMLCHEPMIRYNVCGDSVLGRRWKCSGALAKTF